MWSKQTSAERMGRTSGRTTRRLKLIFASEPVGERQSRSTCICSATRFDWQDILRHAYDLVRASAAAAGVDGVIFTASPPSAKLYSTEYGGLATP